MRRISTLIWLLYLLSRQLPVFADEQNFLSHTTISRDDQITDLCGLSFITDHHDEIIQNTLRLNPHLNEELAKITEVQYNVGDTASFFTINYKTSTSEKVKARCCYKTDRTYIFVGLSEWNSEQVTQTAVDTFYQAFELKTPAGSLDTNKGIRGILESTFGLPPNKSGDGYVTILIYDIQDDYNPAAGNYTYIAGYFNPTDQTNDITSNRKDIIFVDCNPADPNGTDVLSTVAHEFQHLIHHGVDAGEYLNNGAWVDEGLSEYSEVLCGFKLRSPSRYLLHPERSLITFGTYLGDAITDYAKAALWTYYLGEKFGLPLIQAIARDPKHSVDGVQSALTKQGITLSFDDIFANFVVANYANNINLATDGRYGYQSIEMPILPQIAATHNIYPVAKQQKSLPAYAASYLRYTASDSTAILSFGGQSYGTIRAQIYQIGSETKVTQIPLSTTNQGDYNLQAIGKTADEILLVPTSLGTTFIYYYSVSSEIEDVCPPQITSGPNESLSTEKSITIFWQTDELSTTTVEYGTTSEYGSKAENADYVVAHQVTLANLTPNTLYHYRVGSSDAQGNGPTYSADFTFATITIDQRTLTTVQQAHAFGYEARSLVRDLTGILHLVYHEVVGDRRFVYYTQSADTGATWSAAVPIDTTLYHGGMPSMAIDTHHGLHVVWHAKALASSNYAIYYSHSNCLLYTSPSPRD